MIKKLYLLISFLYSLNLFAVEHDIHKQIADIRLEIQKIKLLDARDEREKKIEKLENELKVLEDKFNQNNIDKKEIEKKFDIYNSIIGMQDRQIEQYNYFVATYGVLITILLVGISYISYKFTSREAEEIVNDWIKKNRDKILEPIREEVLTYYQEQIKRFERTNVKKLSEIEEGILKKASELVDKKEEEKYTYDDWLTKYWSSYNIRDYERALFYINGALNSSKNYYERAKALFQKAFILVNFQDKIEEAISYLDEIINKYENDNKKNIVTIYIKSLHTKAYLLGRKNKEKAAVEIYNKIIENFKNSDDIQILEHIKSSVLNKIEMNLILDTKIIKEDELLYKRLVHGNKKELINYEMIKILENAIKKEQKEEISKWNIKFKDTKFEDFWSFEELKTWAKSFEDEEVKNRLLEYIDIFENHNKTIKED